MTAQPRADSQAVESTKPLIGFIKCSATQIPRAFGGPPYHAGLTAFRSLLSILQQSCRTFFPSFTVLFLAIREETTVFEP